MIPALAPDMSTAATAGRWLLRGCRRHRHTRCLRLRPSAEEGIVCGEDRRNRAHRRDHRHARVLAPGDGSRRDRLRCDRRHLDRLTLRMLTRLFSGRPDTAIFWLIRSVTRPGWYS